MEVGSGANPYGAYSTQWSALRGARSAVSRAEQIGRNVSDGNVRSKLFADLNSQTKVYSMNLEVLSSADEMVGRVLDLRV